VEDADVVELFRQAVGQLARSVGGVVVDDEHVHAFVTERAQHRLEVLALVVGGEADDGCRHGRIFNASDGIPRSSRLSRCCWHA
jgi:hypothetical protein